MGEQTMMKKEEGVMIVEEELMKNREEKDR